jgi:CRP-like cAMP-binding protein
VPVDLKKIALFASVPEDALRTLAGQSENRTLPKHAVVINEGDLPSALYVIGSGSVQVYLNDADGKELVLTSKGPGEYFGEMMLDDQPRSACVRTLEPCELAVIPRQQFTDFLLKYPAVALHLIRDLIHLGRGMNLRSREEVRTREQLRCHIEQLEATKVEDLPKVRHWMLAKRAMLATVLVLALMNFYFFDVLLEIMNLNILTVFK